MLMDMSVHMAGVSVTVDGAAILKHISIDVPTGCIIGLLGPSGAGKTTLMRVMVGRQHLDRGVATILGRPAGSAALRGRIGYMPQTAAIYQDLTVRENLRYFGNVLGVGRKEVIAQLRQVDLLAQANQLASTLSGGQRSRVSLAIALLGHPDMLVLDEPTVGVDPVLRQKLWNIFRQVAASGTTLFVSSHVMDEASRCDDLLLMREGKILAHNAPAALCKQTKTKTVEDAFLALVGGKK